MIVVYLCRKGSAGRAASEPRARTAVQRDADTLAAHLAGRLKSRG